MAITLIQHGIVITVNDAFEIIQDGFVAVADGRITAVGAHPPPELERAAAVQVDAGGGIIMPGLVNAHTHLPMTLFRGLADDLSLDRWLNEFIFPAEQKFLSPACVRAATWLACAEMLLSGTTTCCDGYFFEDQVAEVLSDCGLRAVVGQGVIDFPAPGVSDPARNVRYAAEFVERWRARCAAVRPSIFCHSAYTCSARTLTAAKQAARRLGVLFQIHVAETAAEVAQIRQQQNGASPIAYLERLDLLDADTLLVHGVWLDAADMETIARSGAGVVHCPQSNMKLASGIAPLPAMLAAGLRVGLGTDGCASNNTLDLFSEMDTTAKVHKVNLLDPTVMNAPSVLKLATIDGARCLGLGDDTGSLEVGKAADLVVVDTHRPHMVPLYDAVSQIVYAAKASDVRHVMVAGKFRVRNGRLVDLDLFRILQDVAPFARAVADEFGGFPGGCGARVGPEENQSQKR